MELGAEIDQKVKKTIKKQLQKLGCYVDDELPEYIMVMIANKRTREQMIDDLNLFLSNEAEKFVSWLIVILSQIQKAMELPDIDAIVAAEEEDKKKKNKKGKKEKKENEGDNENSEKKKKPEEEEKRKFKEKKDSEYEEREKRKQERILRHKEREAGEKERDEKERRHRQSEHDQKIKEQEREREREIARRRKSREEREEKQARKSEESRKKQKKEEKASEERRKNLVNHDEWIEKETENDIRSEAEAEAKRIEKRNPKNPMDFVKQIACDISKKLLHDEPSIAVVNVNSVDSTAKNFKTASIGAEQKDEKTDKCIIDKSLLENVSLQAVSQYDDAEHNADKGNKGGTDSTEQHDEKASKQNYTSLIRSRRSRSKSRHSQSRSRSPHARTNSRSHHSRSKSKSRHSRSRLRSPHSALKSRSRLSRSKSKSGCSQPKSRSPDARTKSRSHRSRSKSKSRRSRSKSRSPHARTKSRFHHSRSKSKSRRSKSKSRSPHARIKSRPHRSRSNSKSHHHKSQNKHSSSHGSSSTSREKRKTSLSESKDKQPSNKEDNRASVKENAEKTVKNEQKKSVSSKVHVYTDFKRKPSLSKNHQASGNLLKRAVTEVVNEKLNVETEEEELDYTENIDDALHQYRNADNTDLLFSADRRVVNFDQSNSGLATITINFQSNGSNNENSDVNDKSDQHNKKNDQDTYKKETNSRLKTTKHTSSDEEIELRKGLLGDMSRVDARYAILKSRLENNSKEKTKKDRHLTSMVADIEEESHFNKRKGNKDLRRRERRKLAERNRTSIRNSVQKGRTNSSSAHMQHYESSQDEEGPIKRNASLQKETRRIKLQEVSRTIQPAPEDLRNLIGEKNNKRKVSSSEDEDIIARKLREKIKEEKHKRLFGKLNSAEEMKLKKERRNLRDKLQRREKSRKRKHSDEKETLTQKASREKVGMVTDNKDHEDKQCGEGKQESSSNEYVECKQENSGEEYTEPKQESGDEENVQQYDNHSVNDTDNEVEQELHIEGENEEEKQKEEGIVGGNNEEDLVNKCVGIEETENVSNKLEPYDEEDTQIEEDVKQVEEETLKEKNKLDRKSKHKSSKRKRIKHEFIVTLDGLEGGKRLSIQAGTHSKSHDKPSKHRRLGHKHKSREKSSSFTQSDEEFEKILRKKDEENKGQYREKHSHLKTHHSTLSAVDREIILAEKKLKAQKLLKRSLKQVESIKVPETVKHKTAFINPHFRSKVMCTGTEVSAVQLVGHNNISNQLSLYPSLKLDSTSINPVLSPTLSVPETLNQNIISSNLGNYNAVLTSPKLAEKKQPIQTTVSDSKINTQEKCAYWPDCSNKTCPFIHPTVQCTTFPNCPFGNQCLYIHPECKFAERCANKDCIFSHKFRQQTSPICKFFPNCTKSDCTYQHSASQKSCRFGSSCKNPECLFLHDNKPVNRSSLKWSAGKPHVSERTFAMDESLVSETPVTIVTSNT